jgi:hypothetical protein
MNILADSNNSRKGLIFKSLICALKKCILTNRDEKTDLNNASPKILLKSKKKK